MQLIMVEMALGIATFLPSSPFELKIGQLPAQREVDHFNRIQKTIRNNCEVFEGRGYALRFLREDNPPLCIFFHDGGNFKSCQPLGQEEFLKHIGFG